MSNPLTTFILSYERPIYLWATLDSLYRATKSSMRFVLIDSASRDPLVHEVIDSFSRRGMFDEVLRLDENNSDWFVPFFSRRLTDVGDVFFSVESDVIIEPDETCWAQRMLSVMHANPRLAMLGSKIDKTDFVDPVAVEAQLGRKAADRRREADQAQVARKDHGGHRPGRSSVSVQPAGSTPRIADRCPAGAHYQMGAFIRSRDARYPDEERLGNGYMAALRTGICHSAIIMIILNTPWRTATST